MGDEADRVAGEGDECPHGLDYRWCAICLKPRARPPADKPQFRKGGSDPGTVAEFDGFCTWCCEEIIADHDYIVYDEFTGGWKHARCP